MNDNKNRNNEDKNKKDKDMQSGDSNTTTIKKEGQETSQDTNQNDSGNMENEERDW